MSLADILNGLSDIVNPPTDKPPKPLPSIGVDALLPDDWSKQLALIPPRVAAGIASFPTSAYALGGTAINALKGDQNDPNGSVQGAFDISKAINAPVDAFAEKMTGKPVNDSLIHGTPAELAGSWGSLALGSMLKAPAPVLDALGASIKTLKAGTTLAEKAGGAGLQALSFVSPVMMHEVGPVGTAVNMAIPAAASIGLEALFPKTESITDGIKKGTDTAIQGAKDTHAVTAGFTPDSLPAVPPIVPPTDLASDPGVSASPYIHAPTTGNTPLDIALGVIAGTFAIATFRRDVFNQVIGGMGLGKTTTLEPMTQITTQLADQSMPIKATVERAINEAATPNAVDKSNIFANSVDASRSSAIDTKLHSVFDEGQIPGSAVRLPSTNDFYTKLKMVDQPTQDAVAAALNQPRSAWANLQGQQAELVRDVDSTARKLIDYVVEQKQITPSRAAEIRKMNTHEVLRALSGDQEMVRDAARAGAQLPGDVLKDLPTYIEKTIRSTEFGKIRTDTLEQLRGYQDSGQKWLDEVLGARDIKMGAHNEDNVIAYLDRNGLPRTQVIRDDNLFRALKDGASISRLNSVGGALMGVPKLVRGIEQSSTGGIAAALMQPFAHVAAFYNTVFGAAHREPGTFAGPVDKALQQAGFKFGMPGDMSGLAMTPVHALTGVMAVMAKRGAQVLHNHVVRDAFKNGMSPSAANDMATWLSNQYKKNWVYYFQQHGMHGPSAVDTPSAAQAIAIAKSRMTRQWMAGVEKPYNVIGDTYRFINEIAHTVAASPGATVYNLNKSRGNELASRAVRQFAGDTGRSGAFRGKLGEAVGVGARLTPYSNPMIQAFHKFGQAWGKNPVSAAVGTANTVGAAVIGSALWNMKLGPEYTKYEWERRNPDLQASSVYLGLPWARPEHGLEFPVDPTMRAAKLGMHLLTGWKLGLFDGSIHKPENEAQKNAFIEQAGSRWGGLGPNTVGSSAVQQAIIPPVSPVVGVSLALAGKQIRNYGDVQDVPTNKTPGFTSSTATNPNRTLFGLHESANAANIVRSLGSNSVSMAYDAMMEGAQRINEGRGLGDAAANAWRLEKQGAADRFRSVSGLFGSFNTISPSQDSASTLVSQKVKGLEGLIKAFEANTTSNTLLNGNVGNKANGFQQLMGGQIAVAPNDPRMLELSYYAKLYQKQINEAVLSPNRILYEQMNSIRAGTDRSPERKRAALNNMGEQIVKNNQQGLQMLQQFESAMSNTFKTPIKLDKFNPDEGVTGQGGQ